MIFSYYLTGVTILLSAILWYLCTQFTRRARLINKFPGPLTLPFIGGVYCTVWASGHRFQSYIEKQFEVYSNTIRLWTGHKPVLITKDIELIEKILSSTVHLEKSSSYFEGSFFVGEKALIMSSPHLWKPSRKAVVPAFCKSMMETYMDIFNHHTNTMISILDETLSQNPEKFLNLHPTFCRCTCDIISDSIWDEKFDFQRRPEIRLYETIVDCSALTRTRTLEPWTHKIPLLYELLGYQKLEDKIVHQLHEIFPNEFLQKQRKYYEKLTNLSEPSKKYMGLLCTKESLTDIEMFYSINMIFFAGMETSSTCLAIILFLLGNHKQVQEKVFSEIQSELGTDYTRNLSIEDLKRLTYMDLVIKESMRLCTPVPSISRNTGADIKLSNGLVVPKDTEVFLNLQAVHCDPSLYPNPKEFIPERFMDEKLATKNPYAYLLFSKGPRNCIGMQFGSLELKVMLTKVLMKYKFDSENRLEDQHFHFNFVIEPVGGLKVKYSHR